MSNPVVLVVGAGPGLGAAVARRFGAEGYDVALVARAPDRLDDLGGELRREGLAVDWCPADITDRDAFSGAVARLGGRAGRIDVVHFNPSTFRQHDPMTLTPAELLEDVGLGAAPLLTAVQAARPFMSSGSRIVATGSMAADKPWHEAASLGVQKAALRNLVRSVDAALSPDGIRATSVTVRGTLADDGPFAHRHVADALYRAATAPDDDWQTETPFTGGPENISPPGGVMTDESGHTSGPSAEGREDASGVVTRVLVVGDGPVAEALAPMVQALGWAPTVTTSVEDAEAALPEAGAVIVLSHHEDVDGPVIQAALRHGTHYIGAMGSRRTQQRRRGWLLEQGVTPEAVDSVHGPAGLDLGADTPGEIALAILAEAVAVRRGRPLEELGSLRGRRTPIHPDLFPGEATCPGG